MPTGAGVDEAFRPRPVVCEEGRDMDIPIDAAVQRMDGPRRAFDVRRIAENVVYLELDQCQLEALPVVEVRRKWW